MSGECVTFTTQVHNTSLKSLCTLHKLKNFEYAVKGAAVPNCDAQRQRGIDDWQLQRIKMHLGV